MKIVELQYIAPRTLNYMLPVLGDEQSEENEPGKTESPGNDEPSDPGPGGADPSS
jgi:hypothetical protein